jgi:spermidine synthase
VADAFGRSGARFARDPPTYDVRMHTDRDISRSLLTSLLLSFLAAFGDLARGEGPPQRSLFKSKSLYGTLEVTEADSVRYLFVDGVLQTAMYADPGEVAKECHVFARRYWLELLPYYQPQGKRCLLIGLGGGLLPAVLAGYGVETRAVEIDGKVLEAAREYFGYKQPATVGDGREYLERLSRPSTPASLAKGEGSSDQGLGRPPDGYDFIVIDAFAGSSFPYSLASKECFALVKKNLAPTGVFALNLISKPAESPVSASVVRTLKSAFPHVTVLRTDSPERVQSLICFAGRQPLSLKVPAHGRELGVSARELETIAEYEATPSSAEAVILSDGRNPLDHEWAQEAEQWRQRMIGLFGRR